MTEAPFRLVVRPQSVRQHRLGPLVIYSQCLYSVQIKSSRHCLYMSQKRLKTAQVNLRILPDLKEAAEKAAADDQRSLTSLIEKLLTDYLKDKGYLPK